MLQWNEIFKKEGRVFTEAQEDIPKVLRLFKKHNVKKILDLGFGSGRHVVYFAKRGFDVYGIDIAEEGLKLTESWLEKENLKANLTIGSIYDRLPYPDDFFDAIISVNVIHHGKIEAIRKVIEEMERILKPSGLIFVIVLKGGSSSCCVGGKSKVIEPRTYIPLEGKEEGLVHYVFNKNLLKKELKNFKIDIWVRSKDYCILGETVTAHNYCLLGELKASSESKINYMRVK